MRSLTVGALLALCSGCAGFKALERSEWVMVWSDETVTTQMVNGTPIEIVKPTPGAKQEIIPKERYDSEVAEGKRRQVAAKLGQVPKKVTDIKEPIELMVGEVRELLIDEPPGKSPVVSVSGSAVRPYLTTVKTLEDYKEGKEINTTQSSLFLMADDAGGAKVKVEYPGQEPLLIELSVSNK
ncbi:MAG: hypothetical protein JNK82_29530 [Myxococcaceae bacterium]|nr:hypothetical protein [Myxococcaceae bacterium]